MQINMVGCKTTEEEKEIVQLLKEKYKHQRYKFREISNTLILSDKKWIITPNNLIKQLTKRKPEIKIYSAEVIRNALQ